MTWLLKACPFCGSPGIAKRLAGLAKGWEVVCTNCPTVKMLSYSSPEHAEWLWNRRSRKERAHRLPTQPSAHWEIPHHD